MGVTRLGGVDALSISYHRLCCLHYYPFGEEREHFKENRCLFFGDSFQNAFLQLCMTLPQLHATPAPLHPIAFIMGFLPLLLLILILLFSIFSSLLLSFTSHELWGCQEGMGDFVTGVREKRGLDKRDIYCGVEGAPPLGIFKRVKRAANILYPYTTT